MSATTTQTPEASDKRAGVRLPSRLDDVPTQKVPFGRLVHAELRKSVDTRAGRWLLVIVALFTLLAVGILFFAGSTNEDHAFENFLGMTAVPQMMLLPIVGILVVTAEWTQRTGLVTFTLEPHRAKVGWAKLGAAMGLGVFLVLVAIALAALATGLAGALRGTDPSWTIGWQLLVGLLVAQLIGVAQGVGFGMILQNTPAAIVAFLLLPTLWSILGESVAWLKTAAEWLDTQRTMTPLFEGSMQGDDWPKVLVSIAVWVALPLAAGMWRLRRSEVK